MSDKNQQDFLGKKILQNCRNELYLDFPYLDGAFASLEYEADNNISTIATDGEKIYFNPEFLMKKYVEDSALIRRGYLHMLLHCLYLHVFLKPDKDVSEWDRECDAFVEGLIDKAVSEREISSLKSKKQTGNDYGMYEHLENCFDDHSVWLKNSGQASGGRRTKEKWERILAYTSQNKTGTQSRAGSQTMNRQEELDEIYKSRYDYRKFLKQFCRLRQEVELDTESFDYIFYSFGMEHYGNDFPFDKFLDGYRDAYYELVEDGVPAKKGLHEILKVLREKGLKIGVATSSSEEHAVSNLKREGIFDYFDSVITGNMIEYGKPEPDIYIEACRQLKVNPSKAIALEDAINGIRSAHGAGMNPVMIPDIVQDTSKVDDILFGKCESLLEFAEILQGVTLDIEETQK